MFYDCCSGDTGEGVFIWVWVGVWVGGGGGGWRDLSYQFHFSSREIYVSVRVCVFVSSERAACESTGKVFPGSFSSAHS